MRLGLVLYKYMVALLVLLLVIDTSVTFSCRMNILSTHYMRQYIEKLPELETDARSSSIRWKSKLFKHGYQHTNGLSNYMIGQ